MLQQTVRETWAGLWSKQSSKITKPSCPVLWKSPQITALAYFAAGYPLRALSEFLCVQIPSYYCSCEIFIFALLHVRSSQITDLPWIVGLMPRKFYFLSVNDTVPLLMIDFHRQRVCAVCKSENGCIKNVPKRSKADRSRHLDCMILRAIFAEQCNT